MSELTKWPRLLVVGDPITRQQASEVLLRTTDWLTYSLGYGNDGRWARVVDGMAAAYGKPARDHDAPRPQGFGLDFAVWQEEKGILDLGYLHNEMINSSWVGGPHGWCDWDGNIGASTWNIGKWPSTEEVTSDWEDIARAFPFLNLHAQLIGDEGEGALVGTWAVRGGLAALVEPVGLIAEPTDHAPIEWWLTGSGRGVTVERLREAMEHAWGPR